MLLSGKRVRTALTLVVCKWRARLILAQGEGMRMQQPIFD